MTDKVSYKIIGEKGLYKKEKTCPVIGYLDGISLDEDLVAFGRWRNTGEAFLIFRTNNTHHMKGMIVLSEEKLNEILDWFNKKKKEPSELKKNDKKEKGCKEMRPTKIDALRSEMLITNARVKWFSKRLLLLGEKKHSRKVQNISDKLFLVWKELAEPTKKQNVKEVEN